MNHESRAWASFIVAQIYITDNDVIGAVVWSVVAILYLIRWFYSDD